MTKLFPQVGCVNHDCDKCRKEKTTTKQQPKALELADALEQPDDSLRWADEDNLIPKAAIAKAQGDTP